MNQFDRIYALHKLLAVARQPVPNRTLQERLECSPATIKRIIRDMRLYLDAPIEYDRERNGYYYARTDNEAADARFELPGLWFNESEVVSLLVMEELLERTQPGLLDRDLAPIRKRLQAIMSSQQAGTGELAQRVRVLRTIARPAGEYFRVVAGALAMRQRLRITYHGRIRDKQDTREVSPQRLTYYRDNWYLDAWCHQAQGLRSFALDRIRDAHTMTTATRSITDRKLDKELASSYGIFSGPAAHEAVLVFNAEAARWVADEQWHPAQRSRWLAGGRYELRIAFANPQELIRDILAHGANVEVQAPRAATRSCGAPARASGCTVCIVRGGVVF